MKSIGHGIFVTPMTAHSGKDCICNPVANMQGIGVLDAEVWVAVASPVLDE